MAFPILMAKHGKIKKYGKQHFVPQCYTKAWCDPDHPAGLTTVPFVWQFNKNGTNAQKKAPVNLFTETDIYTIERADGERDLRLEHGFQELEDKFTRIRNLRFKRQDWPDADQMSWLLAFVATTHIRTVAMRDFHRDQLGSIRKRMEEMQTALEGTTQRQRAAMASPTSSLTNGRGLTLDDIRKLEERPIQRMLVPMIPTVLSIFEKMSVAVLRTDDPLGFVTTDHPCTWFDPEAYKLPPLYRAPALASSTIEITLPISPSQCLVLTHRPEFQGYIDINQFALHELNRRHIAHCNEAFIVCRNVTQPVWFEQREMPDDAWEKVRERKSADRDDDQ